MKEVWLRVIFSLVLSHLIYLASIKIKIVIIFLIVIMIMFHILLNILINKFGFNKVAIFSTLLLIIIFVLLLLT